MTRSSRHGFALSPGTELGPYRVEELIGAGGMGRVYKATDTRLRRRVAIKTSDERFGKRFEREARAIASLSHPHICTIYDVGPDYLVMEFVEGGTLVDRLAQGPLPLDEALEIAGQIAEALEAVHEKGIIHRDLKPSNIKIDSDGAVKVLDFGLAKIVQEGTAEATAVDDLTRGVILGTPAYMVPEQVQGKPVDKRADICAFGVVLYEMLAGEPPFRGASEADTLAAGAVRTARLRRLSRPPQCPIAGACPSRHPQSGGADGAGLVHRVAARRRTLKKSRPAIHSRGGRVPQYSR